MSTQVSAGSKRRVIAIVFAKDWSSGAWAHQTARRLKRLGAVWWSPSAAGLFLLRTNSTDETIQAALRPKDPYAPWPYTIDVTGSEVAAAGIDGVEQWLSSGDLPAAVAGGASRPEAAAKMPHLEYSQLAPPMLEGGRRDTQPEDSAVRFGGPVGWTHPMHEWLEGYFTASQPSPQRRDERPVRYPDLLPFIAPLEVARKIAGLLKEHMDDYDWITEAEYPGAGEYMAIAEMAGLDDVMLHGFLITSARSDERAEFREVSIDLTDIEAEARAALTARARRHGARMRVGKGRRPILFVYFPKR